MKHISKKYKERQQEQPTLITENVIRHEDVNNSGENYSIEDVKAMNRTRLLNLVSENETKTAKHISHGAKALERIIGVNDATILSYVQCLYLDPETQKLVGKGEGKIPHTYASTVTRLYPNHPEKQKEIEQLIRDGAFKKREGK